METLITDIQRFSLSDGDGIRTTVFFKGCNMHCTWCHNPETLSVSRELMFYETRCIGCGKCFEACPNHAHVVKDGKHVIDRSKCANCGACADVCYAQALTMCGTPMSVEDVMKQVRQDVAYYNTSGGGVTLSGGEVLLHRDFALALIDACHAENIKVAIESNISFPFDTVSELLARVDLIMCDVKIFDDEKHKQYTGISNKFVLENVKKINELNIPFIVRTPLVPGATDDAENIAAIANYMKDMKNLRRYEVLNFNPLGAQKYKGLDKQDVFAGQMPFGEEKLSEISRVLAEIGVPFKIV